MKRLLPGIILMLLPLAASALTGVSREQSIVTLAPNSAPADGSTNIGIVVTVRDASGRNLEGRSVTVRSSRPTAIDVIYPQVATTNSFGVASFSIHSSVNGSPTLTTVADGVSLPTPSPLFGSSGSAAVTNTLVSGATSAVTAQTGSALADGVTPATIYVTVRNVLGEALLGKSVTLQTSRGGQDAVVAKTNPTAEISVGIVAAVFEIRSTTQGSGTYTATVDGIRIQQQATVNFTKVAATQPTLPAVGPVYGLRPGDLVKTSDSAAIYFIGRDNRRHVFPNEHVYYSWFNAFFGIKLVSAQTLASVPQGATVRVRPGMKLVQFVTFRPGGRGLIASDPRVFALERGGALRWIRTAQVAAALYGSAWEREIVPLPETDFAQYRQGIDLIIPDSYNRALVLGSVPTINEDLGL